MCGNYSSCPDYNGGLMKPPFTSGYRWVISSHLDHGWDYLSMPQLNYVSKSDTTRLITHTHCNDLKMRPKYRNCVTWIEIRNQTAVHRVAYFIERDTKHKHEMQNKAHYINIMQYILSSVCNLELILMLRMVWVLLWENSKSKFLKQESVP